MKKEETDIMILGNNCSFNTDPGQTGLNNNVIVCGSSGCGKTMSVAEARLINTHHSSLCISLTKRRLVNMYKRVFADRGYRVWDLDMAHFKNSNVGFDPLAYVRSNQDITHLAEHIVRLDAKGKTSNLSEPYWENAATSLLSAEIAMVQYLNPNATMTDVLQFHEELEFNQSAGYSGEVKVNHSEKFKMLEEMEPHHFAVQCWRSFCMVPSKTIHCIYGTLNTALDNLFSPEIKKMMSAEKKVDFAQLGAEKTVLFVTTSPVDTTMQRFVNIFYGQIFKHLFEFAEEQPSGILPVPVHIMCDDFAVGGRIINFQDYISVFREKGISVSLLIQSETQLASMYGEYDATTIINNCDTYLYMGGTDVATNRNISERLNVPFDEVLYMPLGTEYVFRRGHRPIKTERYDILKDKEYQKIAAAYENEDAGIDR